jgi:hypothetical protein
LCLKFYAEVTESRNTIQDLNKKIIDYKDTKETVFGIEPGDEVIYPNYRLLFREGTKDEHPFTVTYELEVLEVSIDTIKVKATNFSSMDQMANDPKNRSGIIKFIENQWVERKQVQLVIDQKKRRDVKLQEVLA